MSLIEISKELKTQDNLCTSDPLFLVQRKRRIYGFDTQYSDNIAWMNEDGDEADEKLHKELEEYYIETGNEYLDVHTRTSYIDIWEFVTACFTRKGCEDYLKANGHRHGETRIYVDCSYRNKEMNDIRDYILKLT